MTAYQQLEARFNELDALDGASAILHWDSEVMLPSGSAEVRAEQLSALAAIQHSKLTDPALMELMTQAESEREQLSDWQQANLREMRHQLQHQLALPDELVTALTAATTKSEHAWRDARRQRDYAGFQPIFAEVLNLTREAAAAKAEALGLSPYDALLDQYDPGMRSTDIDGYFAELGAFLPDFLQQVLEKQSHEPYNPITEQITITDQQRLSHHFMEQLGFDFNKGRADISTHPFCGGVPGDIRLTSRFDPDNFVEGLYATFHETGHALYETGLPANWRRQPVGKARGMSLHESQSLFMEMQLCLRHGFLTYALKEMHQLLSLDRSVWNVANLHTHLTRVRPSMIRVTADEVTYPLHILLRYELEKALLSGDLPLDDLPAAWDEQMQKKLGIRPSHVGEGCLQDTHWPGGAIGYFPTYSLGAMIAAQLMDRLESELPELETLCEQGDMAPVTAWLRQHIHAFGSFYNTPELIKEATGKPLDVAIYKQHLTNRYLES